jgi:hypothetical protein
MLGRRNLAILWTIVLPVALLAVTTACSVGSLIARAPTSTPTSTKTLRPTFTPTPLRPTATPAPPTPTQAPVEPTKPTAVAPQPTQPPTATPTPSPTEPPPTPTPQATPFLSPKPGSNVNVRSGPGETYPIIGRLSPGQTLAIIGRTALSDWWQVCCLNGQTGWMVARLVDAQGPVDGVPVISDIPPPPPTNTPRPTRPPAPTPTPAPVYAFNLEETRAFDNTNPYVTIWAKIYQRGNPPVALTGYRLRVLKNGSEVGVRASTAEWRDSAPAGFGNAVKYNVEKFEAPLETATWTVYVIDGAGNQVSPAANFQTSTDSVKREFYAGFSLK